MSNLVLPPQFQNAQALAALDPTWDQKSEFSAGIRRSFAVISVRGKVWRVVHQNVSRPVTRPGTNEPASSLEVILVTSTAGVSKVYYAGNYVEGSDDPPTCFSHDGVKPDRSVQEPQASMCAVCPMNDWGSKVTEQGKKTKACADSKRLAILPAGGESLPEAERINVLMNQVFGGPMLLRVPAASMSELAAYDGSMGQMGFKLHAIVTRMTFDIEAAYPKIKFEPVRPLSVAEFQEVLKWRDSAQVKDMLNSEDTGTGATSAAIPTQIAAPAVSNGQERNLNPSAAPQDTYGTTPVQAGAAPAAPATPAAPAAPARGRGRAKVAEPAAAAPAPATPAAFGAPAAPSVLPPNAPVGGAVPAAVPLTVAAPVAQAAAEIDDVLDQLLGD
jgi:hypothetical protein